MKSTLICWRSCNGANKPRRKSHHYKNGARQRLIANRAPFLLARVPYVLFQIVVAEKLSPAQRRSKVTSVSSALQAGILSRVRQISFSVGSMREVNFSHLINSL